jgi:hypothetical protein
LAEFYASDGFVFFLPHRRGQGRSPGAYIMEGIQGIRGDPAAAVQSQEVANEDVVAAMTWLRAQKKSIRIALSFRDAPLEAFRLSSLQK